MTENLAGAFMGWDGKCPDCGENTAIVRKGTTENAGEVYINYHTFCLKCQKKVSEGETIVKADKYGRMKVDL